MTYLAWMILGGSALLIGWRWREGDLWAAVIGALLIGGAWIAAIMWSLETLLNI